MHTNIGPQIQAAIDKHCSADHSEWVLDGATYSPDGYNDVLVIDDATNRILKFTYDPETDTVTTYMLASTVAWENQPEMTA